jgi:hypothetical protein
MFLPSPLQDSTITQIYYSRWLKHRQLACQKGGVVCCFFKLFDPVINTNQQPSKFLSAEEELYHLHHHTRFGGARRPARLHTHHRESFHAVCHSTNKPLQRRAIVYATPLEEDERRHKVQNAPTDGDQATPVDVFLPPASKIEQSVGS